MIKSLKIFLLVCFLSLTTYLTAQEYSSEKADSTINLLEDQQFKAFIETFNSLSQASATMTLEEVRKLSTLFFLSTDTIYEPVAEVQNVNILGKDDNTIPLRIFIPNDKKDLPVVIYFHRGGWVFGNIDEAEPLCRKLANHLDSIVVAVEYRLAPENAFPKPLQDCYAASIWVSENADLLGGDRNNILLFGESAGGNLAAAVALMARDLQGPAFVAQVLICPIITTTLINEVYQECVDQYFLTKESISFFWSAYIQDANNYKHPYASLEAGQDFSNLPPTLIITAEYDPLKYEDKDYANLLHQAHVPVITKQFSEVIHGFIDMPFYSEDDKILWIEEIARLLKVLQTIPATN